MFLELCYKTGNTKHEYTGVNEYQCCMNLKNLNNVTILWKQRHQIIVKNKERFKEKKLLSGDIETIVKCQSKEITEFILLNVPCSGSYAGERNCGIEESMLIIIITIKTHSLDIYVK